MTQTKKSVSYIKLEKMKRIKKNGTERDMRVTTQKCPTKQSNLSF